MFSCHNTRGCFKFPLHCVVLHISVRTRAAASSSAFVLWLWLRVVWAASQNTHYAESFRDRQVAFINRLCIKMRIIHHKPPLSPLTTVCVHHFLSLSVMYMTFPYVLPGEMPKKFNLNTQILSFMVASNSRHLSEGSFFLFFFVHPCVCVYVCGNVCCHVHTLPD